jgi:hypothetical protein
MSAVGDGRFVLDDVGSPGPGDGGRQVEELHLGDDGADLAGETLGQVGGVHGPEPLGSAYQSAASFDGDFHGRRPFRMGTGRQQRFSCDVVPHA